MKVVSFKIPEELDETLEYYARKHGMSKSELIRRAIYYYINSSSSRPYVGKKIKIYG